MKPFMSAREAARKAKAHALAINPCPGRTPKQYQRINRALTRIVHRIRTHMELSNYTAQHWLPSEGVVHGKDDEYQTDLHAQVKEGKNILDSHGYMTGWHDPGIKATNRIVAVSWYTNEDEQSFIIKKPVLSPLPCEQWGRLPITLAQWRACAMTIIESEQLWRWLHAVRYYTDDDSFKPAGIAGWHLEPTQHTVSYQDLAKAGKGYLIDTRSIEERQQDAIGWPGQNIYLDITAGFSLSDDAT